MQCLLLVFSTVSVTPSGSVTVAWTPAARTPPVRACSVVLRTAGGAAAVRRAVAPGSESCSGVERPGSGGTQTPGRGTSALGGSWVSGASRQGTEGEALPRSPTGADPESPNAVPAGSSVCCRRLVVAPQTGSRPGRRPGRWR